MSVSDGALQYRRLRAPAHHGEKLIDPPLAAVPQLIAENRALLGVSNYDFHGQSRQQLACLARAHVLPEALAYTRRYQDVDLDLDPGDASLIMTGHQPELFHPGVWIKNFVVDRVARQQNALALNLLIDNDVLRSPTLSVPSGSLAEPHLESIPFDRPQTELPYEERRVIAADEFRSFGERAGEALRPLIPRPLLHQLWPLAVDASKVDANLGRCLAAARHALEFRWGLRTLELPLSVICDSPPFRWFAVHLLDLLPRFHDVYNHALREYRHVHRLRSRTHPVPELAATDGWLEAPFWLWSRQAPQRRRLFSRRLPSQLEITDRAAFRIALPLSRDGSPDAAVTVLESAAQQGLKLRPRALLTTLYARLFLCDLFVHGIGGAKYDQLTDMILQRCFGFDPPKFLTVSGTAKLPLPTPTVTPAELRHIDRNLRDLRFNPQRYVAPTAETQSLLSAKQYWLSPAANACSPRERHMALTELNAQFQTHVAAQRAQLQQRRADVVRDMRIARLLGSREFSFALFPEETLRPFLLDKC